MLFPCPNGNRNTMRGFGTGLPGKGMLADTLPVTITHCASLSENTLMERGGYCALIWSIVDAMTGLG